MSSSAMDRTTIFRFKLTNASMILTRNGGDASEALHKSRHRHRQKLEIDTNDAHPRDVKHILRSSLTFAVSTISTCIMSGKPRDRLSVSACVGVDLACLSERVADDVPRDGVVPHGLFALLIHHAVCLRYTQRCF
jgi:hypothetical protein